MIEPSYRRDLSDGLVLRWSTAADCERLGELYGYVFRERPDDSLNTWTPAWVRDLMNGHPLSAPGEFALVEDTRSGAIVSATVLMAQSWVYEGIAFPVGRPEIVATMPDYRDRGLVRAIFDLIHARSDARGHMAQGITGISYYYRQFGYEYALELGGSRSVYFSAIPQLKEGEAERFSLRRATREELPGVLARVEREWAGMAVRVQLDESYLRFNLEGGMSAESMEALNILVIVDGADNVVGHVLAKAVLWGDGLPVFSVALEAGVAWFEVIPAMLRGLQRIAAETPRRRPTSPVPQRLMFGLEQHHPLFATLGNELAVRPEPPYAWYVRVPDLPALLRHLAPALERRLEQSFLAGHTGELKISFYRGGLRLAFERGKLATAEPWRRPVWQPGHKAGCPPMVFYQLLFGYRSLDELRYAFPDVWADDEAAALLNTLFPRRPHYVLPLD